jgi:hypothetical protein
LVYFVRKNYVQVGRVVLCSFLAVILSERNLFAKHLALRKAPPGVPSSKILTLAARGAGQGENESPATVGLMSAKPPAKQDRYEFTAPRR